MQLPALAPTIMMSEIERNPGRAAPRAVSPPGSSPLITFFPLSGREKAARLLFLGIVLSELVIGAMCLVEGIGKVNTAFPGFLINERMLSANVGQQHWTGPRAGLHYPDKILKANDIAVSSASELNAVVSATKIGDPILYSIERNGEVVRISVHTMRFSWSDLLLTYGPTFLAGLIYFIIAIAVYALKPDTAVTWAFVLSCSIVSLFQFIAVDLGTQHRFVRLALGWYTFIPAAALHLSLLFPERSRLVERAPYVQVVPYLLSILLVIPMQWLYPHASFVSVYALTRGYLAVSILALLISAIRAFVRKSSALARQRAKVILFGAAIAFPLGAVVNNLSLLGSTPASVQILNTFLPLPLLAFPVAISYAIARHNLFDVDLYIKRTVGYVVMTAIVGLAYFTVQTVVSGFVLKPVFGEHAEQIYPIVFALLVVFFFNPVSRRVQEGVDKLFFRTTYDFKTAVAEVSDAINSLPDLNDVLQHVIQTVRKELFIDKAGVILLDDQKKECRTLFLGEAESEQTVPQPALCVSVDDPLLTLLAKEKQFITKYDIAEDPHYAHAIASCGPRFADMGASLAFPLFARDKFTGVLALGYKKSGHFYTGEDIELLKTVSAMTSSAIEQAQEKEQRATLMQLFSKHVSPQVAESLWQQRAHFLDGGRPRSQKLLITAMFTDLQGFSTISEKQSPEVLMGWLNSYLEMMTTAVMEHGGVVDDFFGDGIKINFGVPIPRETEEEIRQDAINAVNCALAMEQRMIELNAKAAAQGQQPLRMRIGINTGPVVAGSLGSADRMKYTTLGDTVNTAARLESFSKEVDLSHLAASPCRILISESTLRYLGDQFRAERVGELTLKGKAQPVAAYCVLGHRTEGGHSHPSGQSQASILPLCL